MEVPTEVRQAAPWRMAVWALRCGGAGLALILAGLIVMAAGGTTWILGAGVLVWLAAAIGIMIGFTRSIRHAPKPRPGFWSMRLALVHDALHGRPAQASG